MHELPPRSSVSFTFLFFRLHHLCLLLLHRRCRWKGPWTVGRRLEGLLRGGWFDNFGFKRCTWWGFLHFQRGSQNYFKTLRTMIKKYFFFFRGYLWNLRFDRERVHGWTKGLLFFESDDRWRGQLARFLRKTENALQKGIRDKSGCDGLCGIFYTHLRMQIL